MDKSTPKPDVVTLLRSAMFEVGGIQIDNLNLDTRLADLNLDSITVLESIAILEDQLNIRVPDEDLGRMNSLRDLETLITKAQAAS
jgi:acyl carrier protein